MAAGDISLFGSIKNKGMSRSEFNTGNRKKGHLRWDMTTGMIGRKTKN